MIGQFRSFYEREFHLSARAGGLRDGRGSPRIGAGEIFKGLVWAVALKRGSMLQADQMVRSKGLREAAGVVKVSDTTVYRRLGAYEIKPVRSLLYWSYRKGKALGYSTTEVYGEKLRIGITDGSGFGVFYGSVFVVSGKVDLMIDIEGSSGAGKELPTSKKLLRRLFKRFGRGFVDVILVDGLYVDKELINLCLNNGVGVVIKTEEESLNVIEDASLMFSHHEFFKGAIEYVEGTDAGRLCSYKVYCHDDFSFNGVKGPCSVALVEEDYIKEDRHERFFVMAFGVQPTALLLRELGHRRWHIENNGFRQLSSQINSKHTYTHDDHTFLALMLCFFVAWSLWQMFLESLDKEALRKEYGGVRLTMGFFSFVMLLSIPLSHNPHPP